MGMSSTKLTQMIEKHRLVTQVNLLHPIPRINLSESPLLGLDHGGCVLLKRLDNLPGFLHVTPEALGMTHSASKTFLTNLKGQTIKDTIWKGFTQTNSKEIDPRPGNS